jgi:membrane AbrB-like protein
VTSTAVSVVLTLLVSGAVGLAAERLRLPGGSIVWAIAAAAALHLTREDLTPMPGWLRVVAQILIGITIGVGIDRRPLRALYAVRWQLALTMSLLLAFSTAAGLLLADRTPLDVSTALLATGPGGASDMAVAAVYFEVDAALVAGLQVVRQLLVFGLVPLLFGFFPPPAPSATSGTPDPSA